MLLCTGTAEHVLCGTRTDSQDRGSSQRGSIRLRVLRQPQHCERGRPHATGAAPREIRVLAGTQRRDKRLVVPRHALAGKLGTHTTWRVGCAQLVVAVDRRARRPLPSGGKVQEQRGTGRRRNRGAGHTPTGDAGISLCRWPWNHTHHLLDARSRGIEVQRAHGHLTRQLCL